MDSFFCTIKMHYEPLCLNISTWSKHTLWDWPTFNKENEGVATIKVESSPNSIVKPGLCGEDIKGEDLVTLFSGKLTINDPELAFDNLGLTSIYFSDKLEKFGDLDQDGVNDYYDSDDDYYD